MSLKQTTIVKCDHIHTYDKANPRPCGEENRQEDIQPTHPMYHLVLGIGTVSSEGEHTLAKRDMHLCFYCLYRELSGLYDLAKQNRVERQEQEQRHLEAMNNDE